MPDVHSNVSATEDSSGAGKSGPAHSDARLSDAGASLAAAAGTEAEAAQPLFTVAVVARRLGIAPATLRTWDRRYGIGPSSHAPGTRRRYALADLSRLERMRRLTIQGVSPADAARIALTTPRPVPRTGPVREGIPLQGPGSSGPAAPLQQVVRVEPGGSRSGGRVLPLPGGSATARGLARAAMALDASAVASLLRDAVERNGVQATWEGLLRPVLVAIGQRFETTGEGVEVEHLLVDCAQVAVRQVPVTGTALRHRPVLLSCSDGEAHSLPIHVLAAALVEIGISARVFGVGLPAQALYSAVRRLGPAVVFVYAQMPGLGDPQMLSGLPVTRPGASVVVGGRGWDDAELGDVAGRVASLTEATDAIRRALVL
jgi:transposase-like protein